MQIIENLIQRKVDIICVSPSGSKEIVPAIVKANKANIPVLIVDTRIDLNALEESGGEICMLSLLLSLQLCSRCYLY